ncbi:membrane-attack complex / perforin [Mactra antiquata]
MMETIILVLYLLSGVFAAQVPAPKKDDFPIGDPRRCSVGVNDTRLRFEVLPGGGWDNLRNKDMGMITQFNYSRCRTTDDGKFLIPDGIYTIPIKSSNVETYAELIMHWDNFTSTLSRGVNIHAGLHLTHVGISGKFSDEYQSVKATQHLDKSVTTRIQVRYVQYSAKLEPDTPINDAFRSRLKKIAAHITLNKTDLARYESQLLVRDFGSHQLTSIDVGAALVQLDELSATYLRKYESQKNTILASASASFFGVFDFGIDTSDTTTKTQIDEYLKQRTTSKIMTFGGPVFRPKNYTANMWGDSIQNELVALDRSGDPLYYAVTDINLPDVPLPIVQQVFDYVKDAVELYYEHNTYRGCTNEDSPNFSFPANVDDGSCKPPKTNFTFGGVYQTCTGRGFVDLCKDLTQKNPQTGSMSCPSGYESIPLQSGSVSKHEQRRECDSCWIFFTCCDTYTVSAYANYQAYWCAATGQVKQDSGFLFGGLYTSKTPNIMTQSQSCPSEYYPLKLFGMTDYLVICVSDDYELGYRYSLPFAGFFSCNSGNPLALKERMDLLQKSGKKSMLQSYMVSSGVETYPKSCPEGYSQHLAINDNSCSIHFCVKVGSLTPHGLPAVKRPPFMNAPRDGPANIEYDSYVLSGNGQLWTSKDQASEAVPKYMAKHGMKIPSAYTTTATYQSSGSYSNSLSGGVIAGIAVTATLVCVIVGALITIKIRKRRRTPYRETDPWAEQSEGRRINTNASRAYDCIGGSQTTIVTST